MANLSETSTVPVSCPKCGEMIQVLFAELDQDPHVTCENCEHHFEVSDEEIRKIERSFDDSSEALKEQPDLPDNC